MEYDIIKIGTAQYTFPPISYKLKNLTTWFIWSIWSGRSPKILFNNGRLVPDKNDGRKIKIKGTITAITDEFVFAETNIVRDCINKHPRYPPRTIKIYSWAFVIL